MTIKNVSYASLFLNLISLVLGIVYLTCFTIGIRYVLILWDVFGVIIIITFFANLFFLVIYELKLNKNTKLGNRLNLLCYIYLIFVIMGMLLMAGGNFLISVTYSNNITSTLGFYSMVYCSYFGILLFGMGIACLNIKNLDNREIWDISKNTLSLSKNILLLRKIVKIILKITCYLSLIIGVHVSLVVLFGVYFEDFISMIYGLLSSFLGFFLVFIFLSVTILLLKLKDRRKNTKGYYAVGITGISLAVVFMIPLVITPLSMYRAEANFSAAFGHDWRGKIDSNNQSYFLQTPFSIQGYFLGKPPNDCIIREHVLFYDNGTEGIQLYFDAYMPRNNGIGLPGRNSTLIRIHGGGWVFGDKGQMNMMQMNKYFAAQGYVVFDIQYGIKDVGLSIPLNPAYKIGNFTMNDIMRHIGNFTQYLANHSTEYGADLDSVFISGGSAGGQLTCATAFGIHSGNYTHIFGNNLTIKGVIPFYPGLGPTFVGGNPDFINPQNLINASSPPCLIYQGTQDNWVHPSNSQILKDTYTSQGNNKCAIIWLEFASHASDIYFTGYYNQLFLYYMERFMFLCVYDLI